MKFKKKNLKIRLTQRFKRNPRFVIFLQFLHVFFPLILLALSWLWQTVFIWSHAHYNMWSALMDFDACTLLLRPGASPPLSGSLKSEFLSINQIYGWFTMYVFCYFLFIDKENILKNTGKNLNASIKIWKRCLSAVFTLCYKSVESVWDEYWI